jgi:hypothetical protein
MRSSEKQVYSTPKLTVHGRLEDITKGCDKVYGNGDGYTFNGASIVCPS